MGYNGSALTEGFFIMINPLINLSIRSWIMSRGIPNSTPKHEENIHRLAAALLGELLIAAVDGNKTDADILDFVELCTRHTVTFTNLTGRPFEFDDLLSDELRNNFFYTKLRKFFLTARLGGVQSGDGEVALTLLSSDGSLIINNKKADVFAGGYSIQCKKRGSNNESPSSMEAYQSSEDVDLMLIISPDALKMKRLNGSDKRGINSRVWVFDTKKTHWSSVVKFTGKEGKTLSLVHEF